MGTPGGAKLRAVREQAGRSQLWVEAEADLGTGYLQRVESGRVVQPGRATVERILDALDARYSERRDVLELFGYIVATPLPTPAETEWATESCLHELHDVPFPAYVLDCFPRLIAWNRFVPRLLGDRPRSPSRPPYHGAPSIDLPWGPFIPTAPRPSPSEGEGREGVSSRSIAREAWGEAVLERLVGQSMLAPWFDPSSPFGALVAEPDIFLPALIRAMRYEIERFRSEPWLAEMLARVQAELPRFREYWTRAEQEPAPISAARILVPVRLAVPGVGLLQFRLVSEPFVRDTRFRLIYYVPADASTMRQCAAWATNE
jgi:transcriptional regulator with XRE-family HTH domain